MTHMPVETNEMINIALSIELRLVELKNSMHFELYDYTRFSPIVYFKIVEEIGGKTESKIRAADIQVFIKNNL